MLLKGWLLVGQGMRRRDRGKEGREVLGALSGRPYETMLLARERPLHW